MNRDQKKGNKMKKNLGPTNSTYPAPVLVIGTYDEKEKPNAMVVAWGGFASTAPPMIAISMDEHHYTYKNIERNRCFTVNTPNEKHVKEADYFGMSTGRSSDKFQVTGLTATKGSKVNAPIIDEFPLALECQVTEIKKIGDCMHIIGEIVETVADEDCLDENGTPDISRIKPVIFDPVKDEYYFIGKPAMEGGMAVGDGLKSIVKK